MNQIYNEILSYIDTLEIIDTHEHLPSNTLGKNVPLQNIGYFAEACKKYCE